MNTLPVPVLSIIFSFEHGKEMALQKQTSKLVKTAVEYTDVMKKLEQRKDSVCKEGVNWCDHAFDSRGVEYRGYVISSCGDLKSVSSCALCGINGAHHKCIISLRATFCDPCGYKISPVNILHLKQKYRVPTDIIIYKQVAMCYADDDHSCEGDCIDDCIGYERDGEIFFTGQQIVEMLNN
jgi:hypothetical protein